MVVVQVGRVIVAVDRPIVVVAMRVLSDDRRIVDVIVMTVIVPMCVLVVRGDVRVLVAMLLGDVQIDADREAARRREGPPARDPIAERKRDRRANERGQGEHRARACGADPTLGQ
jgi:hypothetical protein